MRDKSNDDLAALGWSYVARDHMGKVVAVTNETDSYAYVQIMGWLSEGYTVQKLFM